MVDLREIPPWDEPGSLVATMQSARHTYRMPIKFLGTLQELKDRLLPLDLDGNWEPQPNGVWKFKCRDHSGLLWSETKGTVWFDGPRPVREALSNKVEAALANGAQPTYLDQNKTIFVVHGRDQESRDQLELVLRRLRLEPFVLQVSGGGGDTLIEVLEKMIGKAAQSAFGIVLLTPDDIGRLQEEKPEEAKPRARQNVILEMGMLLASLTRKRCAILQKGFVEQPSNMGGVIFIPFNNHVREAVPKLVQRLEAAGFKLNPADIGAAQA
jgi:predicted nucleotide-binding protein